MYLLVDEWTQDFSGSLGLLHTKFGDVWWDRECVESLRQTKVNPKTGIGRTSIDKRRKDLARLWVLKPVKHLPQNAE